VPITIGPKENTKGSLALEVETDEEEEEPLEERPTREVRVKVEKSTGRKRRNLVEHSPFPDLVSLRPQYYLLNS